MIIPPKYTITPEMLELISKIDALRMYFLSLSLAPQFIYKLNRVSLLKSSLFSAKIEGNSLSLRNFDENSEDREHLEIQNIVKAHRFVDRLPKKSLLTVNDILTIHSLVLHGLDSNMGRFRTEQGAIFNQAGIVVYLPPPPTQVTPLMESLVAYCNSTEEPFPLVQAFVSHLVFEKIHPFIDGNGRVGRLLIKAILRKKRYEFSLRVPFEELIEQNKADYYDLLETGMSNPNDFLLYMLQMFLQASQNLKLIVDQKQPETLSIPLPPRQEEIYELISERSFISFDSLQRRFLKVPKRALRYDLKKLLDLKLIFKHGETKGAFYTTKKVQ